MSEADPVILRFKRNAKSITDLGLDALFRDSTKSEGKDLVLKFTDDPEAPLKPHTQRYKVFLASERSESDAARTVDTLASALRHGLPLPRDLAVLLSRALQRVHDEGQSLNFLYGPQKTRGRPPKDVISKFDTFYLVETLRQAYGRLNTSRNGEGAYDIARELLRQQGTFLEVDEIKRTHQSVYKRAAEEAEFLLAFMDYLADKGYELQRSQTPR